MSKPAAGREVERRVALATTFDRGELLGPEALLDGALARYAEASGAEREMGLVIDAHLRGERLDGLISLCEKRRELPVLAIEAGSGLRGRPALGALDRSEGNAAIAETEGTLKRAAAVGASYVVLRLGWVEGARRDWSFARDRFLRDALTPALRQGLLRARDQVAPGHLDRARAALDRLCRQAEAEGVMLLVKNGQRYVELPSPGELDVLREDLRGAPLGALYDRPAAHLVEQMGFFPAALMAAAFGGGPMTYIGDACGAVAALPPGMGELGRAGVRETIAASAAGATLVFRPWAALRADEISEGLGSCLIAARSA